jgi:hypothetical protein
MTPQEALNLLDKIVSEVNLNRVTHIQVQLAVEALRKAITPQPKPEKKA